MEKAAWFMRLNTAMKCVFQEGRLNRMLDKMCSTCNYNLYENKEGRLQQSLGMGSLVIQCDQNGKNYKLAVNNEPKSEFAIYRCPTCGRKLYFKIDK